MIKEEMDNIMLVRNILVDHAQRKRKRNNYKIREYMDFGFDISVSAKQFKSYRKRTLYRIIKCKN
ncbi:unnamed protein product [Paramecium pentaurelia]|uniref:Uncharacterized protein n=1 Tax=Paramecium pentaurelia TaxID=43138 RepID=A0A8S1VTE8_9CILI|nr:unnamed protein product [Paramecium pentaurelia]